MSDAALPTPYQEYIHNSKYSRWRGDLGRRETWLETVDRYLDFWEGRAPDLVVPERDRLRAGIASLGALPSMRGLMTAGDALAENECAIYNCSFLTISRPEAFDEALLLLMCGVGVGFSVERRFVSKLPTIPTELDKSDEVIVVSDSKYGWAVALRRLIKSLYAGKVPSWDLSKVRPAGSILKTFGGRASGPAPLEALFRHVVETFVEARGRQLSTVEAHSICCKIGDIVIVGGVRRSAMIDLFDADDKEMRLVKSGSWFKTHPHFGMANNSAVYELQPSPAQFLYDFSGLIRSQAGEPGIFNRQSAQAQAAKWGKRPYDVEYGTNPCFTGDTLVATADGRGPVRFSQLASEKKDVLVYAIDENGNNHVRWMRNPRKTGTCVNVVSVELDDGQIVRCTPNHEFKLRDGTLRKAADLQQGDSLHAMTRYQSSLDEVFGGRSRDVNYWWINTGLQKNRAEHRMIAEFVYGSRGSGWVVHHDDNVSLNNSPENLVWMEKTTHDELHRERMLGDNNPMRQHRSEEWWARYHENMSRSTSGELNGRYSGVTDEEIREHALVLTRSVGRRFTAIEWLEYAKANNLPQSLQSNHRRKIGSVVSLAVWAASKCGFPHARTTGQRACLNHKVVAVRQEGKADVYNGTVDEYHNFFVGGSESTTRSGKPKQQYVNAQNCGEIILRDRSFCNLSQITVRGRDTKQQLLDKLELATILGTLQATLTNFKHLSPEWQRNCEEERLLGVSMTGNPDHALLNGSRGLKRLDDFLEEAREHVWEVNADWAGRLGISPAAASTCLKPAGNTSQLTMAASPLKPWHDHQYVRRTRATKTDPVTRLLIDQGVPHEDEAWHPDTTVVFEWPQRAPAGAKIRTDWSAIDQLELWKSYRDHWCDHNPSVTVNVTDDEWPAVASWVWSNWKKMTGVTFLPHDDHSYVQAPYESLDEETFDDLVSRSPRTIDWSKLSEYELEDETESSRELACTAGACSV